MKLGSEDGASPYVLAVDGAKSTLAEVTSAISAGLGSGKVHTLNAADADALLLKDDSISSLQVRRSCVPRVPVREIVYDYLSVALFVTG